MANVTKSVSKRIAYVLDEDIIKRFSHFLAQVNPALKYEIKTSDGTTLEYTSIEDVLSFPNLKTNQIDSLSIGTHYSSSIRIHITFNRSTGLHDDTVHLYLYGEDQKAVFYYFNELDSRLKSISLSRLYNVIAFMSGILVWVILLLSVILCAMVTLHVSILDLSNLPVPILFVFAIINYISLEFVDRFKNYLFPKTTFLIGAGMIRHKHVESWRNVVLLSGIVLPLLVAVAPSIVSAIVQAVRNP